MARDADKKKEELSEVELADEQSEEQSDEDRGAIRDRNVAQVDALLVGAVAAAPEAAAEVKAPAAAVAEEKKDEQKAEAKEDHVYMVYVPHAPVPDEKKEEVHLYDSVAEKKEEVHLYDSVAEKKGDDALAYDPYAPIEDKKAAAADDKKGAYDPYAPVEAKAGAGGDDKKDAYDPYAPVVPAGVDEKKDDKKADGHVYGLYQAQDEKKDEKQDEKKADEAPALLYVKAADPAQAEAKAEVVADDKKAAPEEKGVYARYIPYVPGQDGQVAGPVADAKEVVPDAKVDAKVEDAEAKQTDQAKLRSNADAARGAGPRRVALTEIEQKLAGWAVLPMLQEVVSHDEKGTNYLYDSAEDAAAGGGAVKRADRGDYLWEVRDGKLVKAGGHGAGAIAETRGLKPNIRSTNLAYIKALASILREHGMDAAADEVAGIEPTAPIIQARFPAFYRMVEEADAKAGVERKETAQGETGRRGAAGVAEAGGKAIFAMNAAGAIYAAPDLPFVIHHSSFLAGGAVAAAGEITCAGGTITKLSNNSGHYRPGPAYLWQAVKQLEMLGVAVGGMDVEVLGAGTINGAVFLAQFDPAADAASPSFLSFDAAVAIAAVRTFLRGGGAVAAAGPAAVVAPAADAKGDGGPK